MRRSKKKDFSKVIKKQNKSWFHRLVSGAFLAPSVLGVLLFFVLPFLVVIYFSFVNNPVAKKFVGLTNYINVIQNGAFRTAVGNTLFFSVVAVPLAVILGMALAFLLDAVPVQYSIQQPDHRKQGFETDTDRTDGTGCSPLADQYRIHGDHVHDPYLYHSIHGRICACKEEICGTAVTFYTDRMRNGITKTGYFDPITS